MSTRPDPAYPATAGLGPPLLPLVEGQAGVGAGPALLCVNPATGEAFGHVACANGEEIDRAVESAAFAAKLWRSAPFEEHARALNRLAERVRLEAEEIAGLIALEQGKPFVEALNLEVLPALDHLKFLAKHARDLLHGEPIDPRHPLYAHKDAFYLYDPVGVVALVTSSPLPFAQPLVQAATALVLGNAVVLKPSEHAPMCGLRVGQLCVDSGFPAGLVNVVPASREDTLHLVSHERIDKVFVSGSLEAGQNVMVTAGCAPRPVVLALGGKHPAVVAADADLDRAARGIVWGAFANAGQNCGAVERCYVEEAVAARFIARVLELVDALRLGDPLSKEVEIGPMVSDEHRRRVHAHVEDAVHRGGRLLRGGTLPDGPGFFYPPTVVLDPPEDSLILHEETAGPALAIVVVPNLERALMLANESDYALTASGWTSSQETAERIAASLEAGVVTINDVLYAWGEPAASWSGFKRSGLGQVHGRAGLQEMVRRRFVSFDPEPGLSPLFAFPYDEPADKMSRTALAAMHAPTKRKRFFGVLRLVRNQRFRERVNWKSFLLGRKRQK